MSFTTAPYPPISTINYVSTITGTVAIKPTDFTGCQLWLDATDSTTFTLSGSSITQWRDKSGNANHMANNGTSPVYNSSLINSKGGVDCTNGGAFISAGFQNSANVSFAMVVVVKSGIGTWGSFFTHGNRDSDFAVEQNGISPTKIHFQTANDNSSCDITYTVDVPAIYFGTMTTGTSRFFESFSGTTNTTVTGTNSSSITLGSQLARIGKSDANEVCNSYIGEMIYYNVVLTTTQRQQIEGYLAWKWGIQAALPLAHPYYSTNPNLGATSTVTSTLKLDYIGYTSLVSTIITPASFTPTTITGCKMWLDATDAATLTLSAGNMTQWTDKSGTGNTMTPYAGNSNVTVSSAYQNGLNVLNFSGGGIYRTPASTAIYPLDVYVIVAVKDLTTAVDVLGMGATSTDNFNSLTFSEHTSRRWHNGSSGFSRTPNCVSPSDETLTSFVMMQWSIADANYLLRRNGTQLVQTASYTFSLTAGSVFQLGLRYPFYTGGAASNPFKGYIGEILLYNTQLGTTDRQKVEGYLAWKWGLQASLPAGHPYLASSPSAPTTTLSTFIIPKPIPTLGILPYYTFFNPISLSSLALWIDGADPLGTGVAPTQGTLLSSLKDKSGKGYPISTFSTTVGFPTYATAANGSLGAIQLAAGNGLQISSLAMTPYMSLYLVYSPILPSTGVTIEQGANALANVGFLLTSVSTTSTVYTFGTSGTTLIERFPLVKTSSLIVKLDGATYSAGGSTWTDSVASANWTMSGTTYDSVTKAVVFSSSYAYVASVANFNSTIHSVVVYYYRTVDGNGILYQINRSPANFEKELLVYERNTWEYDSGYGIQFNANTSLSGNTGWVMRGYVKNGTTGTFYYNGVPDGTYTASLLASIGNSDFALGRDYRDNNTFLGGKIALFAMWNVALSASDMATIHSNCKAQFGL